MGWLVEGTNLAARAIDRVPMHERRVHTALSLLCVSFGAVILPPSLLDLLRLHSSLLSRGCSRPVRMATRGSVWSEWGSGDGTGRAGQERTGRDGTRAQTRAHKHGSALNRFCCFAKSHRACAVAHQSPI